MPKTCYKAKKFRGATLETIKTANAIIEEYVAQDFTLTVRSVYYQMVARGHIENSLRSYKNFSNVVNDARLAGLIDWLHIVDNTRNLRSNSHFANPASLMRSAVRWYQVDKWARQPYRVEVWIEKDALVGVIQGVCSRLDVPYFACRGYNSQSEAWAAGQRLAAYRRRGQTPIVLHLGDHDPSGVDMTRDVGKRLDLFAGDMTIERLALNWDQIQTFNPPPNFAKEKDARFKAYYAKFGGESWELDALDPTIIAGLIESAVGRFRDEALWSEAVEEEEEGLELLQAAADRWHEVIGYLQNES